MLVLFPGDFGTKETLRFIEEEVGLGLWSWDFASGEMTWSRGVYTQLGVDPANFVATHDAARAMVHPDDQRIAVSFEEMLLAGSPATRRFRIIRPNGRVRWLEVHGETLFDRSGHPTRAIGITLDKTNEHEAQEQQHAIEQRYRAAVDSFPALVWFADHTGAAVEIHGLDAVAFSPDFLGHGWEKLIHPDERDLVVASWKEARASGSPFEAEHRLREPDGTYRWRRTRALPVRSTQGQVKEYACTSKDIHLKKSLPVSNDPTKLTGAQIRMARALLHWPLKRLAERSEVSELVIRRLETIDGPAQAPLPTLTALMDSLSDAGVDFCFPHAGKPGVSPR